MTSGIMAIHRCAFSSRRHIQIVQLSIDTKSTGSAQVNMMLIVFYFTSPGTTLKDTNDAPLPLPDKEVTRLLFADKNNLVIR